MTASPSDIRYFVEIAATLNVSRAAERLGISQPSLSLAIQRLERGIGAPLLTRGKKGVLLTRAGQQLLAHARSLLQSWDQLRVQALASLHEAQGDYTIGCHSSVALSALARFLPQLLRDHPKLNISLKHDISRKVTEDVISSKIDIGIVVNPVRHPDLVIHSLCTDVFTLWSCDKIKNKDVLICDPDLAQAQFLIKKLEKAGMRFERILTSSSLEVIADLSLAGSGFGLLPGRVASAFGKGLKPAPKAPVFHDEYCLLYRMENKQLRALQAISSAIRAVF